MLRSAIRNRTAIRSRTLGPCDRRRDGAECASARAVVEVPCCARGTVPATASPPEEASSFFFLPAGRMLAGCPRVTVFPALRELVSRATRGQGQ